jgi:recombination protein RecA
MALPKAKKPVAKIPAMVLEKGKTDAGDIVKVFNKAYGVNSLQVLNLDDNSKPRYWVSTGSFELNNAITKAGWGVPFGKIVTITGKKSSGKTTIAQQIVAEAQKGVLDVETSTKVDADTFWLDAEIAFDQDRAVAIGVDPNRMMIGQPDYLEQVFEKLESIIEIAEQTKRPTVVVWDSVAASPTQKELEGDKGEGGHYGEHSKLLSQWFRKIAKRLGKTNILFFIINQVKVNINAMYDKDTYIGKNALDFHSHLMMTIYQSGKVEEDDTEIGIASTIEITKNRLWKPFEERILHIMFGDDKYKSGCDVNWEALEIGKRNLRARLNGSWNQIIEPCSDCLVPNENTELVEKGAEPAMIPSGKGPDGKTCPTCEGTYYRQIEGFKQFYARDIQYKIEDTPGLLDYLVNGTPMPALEPKTKKA